MNRGKPLRRTGIQRGTTRVKPRSDKRVEVMVARRRLVVAMLTAHPRCQVQWACRGARAVDVHERIKRSRGGNILDPIQAHMVTACRTCHELTESEPAQATARRMLLPSWHECPPCGPC